MKITNLQVFNFEGAFRGMRNPMNSWNKSDSCFDLVYSEDEEYYFEEVINNWIQNETKYPSEEEFAALYDKYKEWFYETNCVLRYGNATSYQEDMALLGPKDLELAQKLIRAGSEHRKFLRQIFICFDLTAPLYFWKEFDTYKVGTVSNSTSTMHKLATTPITLECFETDDYEPNIVVSSGRSIDGEWEFTIEDYTEDIIDICEKIRQKYLETKDKKYWKELIRWLPESWLQTRTITMNYENVLNIIHQRSNHKLSEWNWLVEEFKQLPYSYELLYSHINTEEVNEN